MTAPAHLLPETNSGRRGGAGNRYAIPIAARVKLGTRFAALPLQEQCERN
jgi:hypothetical protein